MDNSITKFKLPTSTTDNHTSLQNIMRETNMSYMFSGLLKALIKDNTHQYTHKQTISIYFHVV